MNTEKKTKLRERIESGKAIVTAEIVPANSADPAAVRTVASKFAGKVHALSVSDNRDGVGMSALAACSVIGSENVEPILHMVTRDRNRIALASDWLGAQALGIRNVLCTSGTHQTLGLCRDAKNVYDMDSIQLLQTCAGLADNNSGVVCLGAVAAPYADPMEMQVSRLAKKVQAGAQFLVTEPVFDLERFEAWWKEVTRRGIHETVAILAGIHVLGDAETTKKYAGKRPDPRVPAGVVERIASGKDHNAQLAAAIEIAVETIKRLSAVKGLRGFEISGGGDDDAAVEVIKKSGLGVD